MAVAGRTVAVLVVVVVLSCAVQGATFAVGDTVDGSLDQLPKSLFSNRQVSMQVSRAADGAFTHGADVPLHPSGFWAVVLDLHPISAAVCSRNRCFGVL